MTERLARGRAPRDTQTLILQTALQLFTEKGYFNTSVHDIKRTAGISIGSIYHHFAGKEAIAAALYDYLVAWMATEVEEVGERHPRAYDRFRAIIARFFALAEEDPTVLRFILHARHQEFLPAVPPVCSSRPFQVLLAMVEEGMAQGDMIRTDPVVAVSCLLGGALRLIHLKLDGVLADPLASYLEEVWRCSWRGVAPR